MRRVWQALTTFLAAIANWRWFRSAVFVVCLIPAASVIYDLCQVLLWNHPDALGVDPTKTLLHETGEDALAFLLVTLSVTPARRIFKINRVQIVRRLLGVTAFFYALGHVSIYLLLNQLCYSVETCDVRGTWNDILKRKFIFAGMTAFSIMAVLAITSTGGWVRRLKKRWATLHRFVYVAGIAGIVHFIWIQKSDIREPLKWALWLTVLFAIRLYFAWQKRQGPLTRRAAQVPRPKPQPSSPA
jgi:sulfoxide reductase heme-binding subunit YedZ